MKGKFTEVKIVSTRILKRRLFMVNCKPCRKLVDKVTQVLFIHLSFWFSLILFYNNKLILQILTAFELIKSI